MATSESHSVLQAISILSTISINTPPFSKVLLPRHGGVEPEPVSQTIVSLLDALTFFFPTIPHDNRIYAMTLSATGEEVIATLAANDAAHLGPNASPSSAAFPESQQSPSDILRTIWGFMIRISKDVKNASYNESYQLIQYLLRVHALKIRHRFSKYSKEFDQFWSIISTDKTTSNAVSSQQEPSDILSSNRKQSAIALPTGSRGYTYTKTSNILKSYLNAAKTIYDSHKAFYAVDDFNLLMKALSLPRNCRKLEKLLSDYDKGYLIMVHKAAKLENNKFDIIRCISKLCAPVLNILTIEVVAASRKFTILSTLPLKIKEVTNSHSTGVCALTAPPKDVAEFLEDNHVPFREYKFGEVSQAIQAHVDNAVRQPIPIAQSHCECLLVSYHDCAGPLTPHPFPYIGVSKCPCFQCGIYIDAYNASNTRTLPIEFSVRGRRSDIVPCLLPTISKEVDSSIAEHMMDSIRAVVTAMLDADVQTSRLSQSPSWSVDEEDISDELFILFKQMGKMAGERLRMNPGYNDVKESIVKRLP